MIVDVDVDCKGIYKVTGDNYDMGYQSAKYITEKVGPAANIVVMDVPPPAPSASCGSRASMTT